MKYDLTFLPMVAKTGLNIPRLLKINLVRKVGDLESYHEGLTRAFIHIISFDEKQIFLLALMPCDPTLIAVVTQLLASCDEALRLQRE
jgi:hypothetical protein